MNYEEALAWLRGARSMTNIATRTPVGTFLGRVAMADAFMCEQAYWIVRAYREKLVTQINTKDTIKTKHPIQPLVKDKNGILRFKENAIVRHLLDTHPNCNLNDLACMDFTNDDRRQFAQLIGYSLSGYGDLSYVDDAEHER